MPQSAPYKPGSVPYCYGGHHSSGAWVAPRPQAADPGPCWMHAAPHGGPYLALHPPTGRHINNHKIFMVIYFPTLLPKRWWALTPPFRPYPGLRRGKPWLRRGGLFSVALWSALAEGAALLFAGWLACGCPDFPRGLSRAMTRMLLTLKTTHPRGQEKILPPNLSTALTLIMLKKTY